MKKLFITLIPALMFIAFSASLCACSDDKVEEPEEPMPPVPSPGDDGEACAVALSLDINQINELSATENNSEYRIKTNGGHDPWIYTKQLPKDLTEEAVVLAFDYKSTGCRLTSARRSTANGMSDWAASRRRPAAGNRSRP